MTTTYNVNNSLKGVNGFGTQFCDTIFTATLAAATEETFTVPGKSALGNINSSTLTQYVAVFSFESNLNFYVAVNATAAVPAGGTFAASTSVLNPKAKIVKQGDVIHVICATAGADVSVELFYIQEG